jgi:MYXO-CTERM domain-containing protein
MDKDGDGLTNLQEYLNGSDPCDEDSPGSVRYVSPDGVDNVEGGSASDPWRTISFALTRVNIQELIAPRIRVAAGVYTEDLDLIPNVSIEGPGCDLDDPAYNINTCAVIDGEITGAEGARLEGVVLRPGAAGNVILTLNDVNMSIDGVVFLGDTDRTATAIMTTGDVSATIINNSDFSRLGTGLDVGGTIPVVRRNLFTNHADAYIRLRATDVKQINMDGLGLRTNPNSGFNRFDFPATGDLRSAAIVNERPETIMMEGNDWGTDDPDAIDALIDGPADFMPFLPAGSAILAGALFVTVWDAVDQAPVLDAAVSLQVSPYDDVTDNEAGVYPFAAVQEGQYTVTVISPDFAPVSTTVNVGAGEVKSIVVPLGGMMGKEEGGGCGCGPAQSAGGARGDAIVVLLVLTALVAARRRTTNA